MLDIETCNVQMSHIYGLEIMNYQSKIVIQVKKDYIQVVNMFIKVNSDFWLQILNFYLLI